jgi:hypothetical protein
MRARRDRGGPKPRRQDPLGLAERKRTGGTVNAHRRCTARMIWPWRKRSSGERGMSRGPGRIERAIRAQVAQEPPREALGSGGGGRWRVVVRSARGDRHTQCVAVVLGFFAVAAQDIPFSENP